MNYLIVNPVAGRGRCRTSFHKVEEFFKEKKLPYEIAMTKEPGHAEELASAAASNGASTIISVGGDGTFSEILNGLYDKDISIGVLPAGTGNDFARSIGFSTDLEVALQQLSCAQERNYDIGIDKDGVFSNVLGLGFATDVMHYVNTHRNGLIKGPLAIAAGVYHSVKNLKPDKLTITVDGETFDTEAIMVAVVNTQNIGGGMKLVPHAVLDDGFLDLAIVRPLGKLDLLRVFPKIYKGQHTDHPAISFMRGKEFEIYSERPMIKMFDGNTQGETPIKARIIPHAIRVLAPGEK